MSEFAGMLSKKIPARVKTERFTWIRQSFMEMSQQYRDIRKKLRPMDSCFWCRHKFEDGETMNLAARPKGANVVLCDDCCCEALKETEDE